MFLDFLFPPSEIWREIRNWEVKDVLENCKRTQHPYSIFSYKDPYIKEMIYSIKFKGNRQFAIIFGEILWNKIKNKKGILIPIPVSFQRRKERGFNQCEWLCEEMKRYDYNNNLKYNPKILIREKEIPKQSQSNLRERELNIQNIFSVREDVEDKDIILIDDVITTGSTSKEAQRILMNHGARKVDILTIAH